MSSHDFDAMPKSTGISHRLAGGAAQRTRSDVEPSGAASLQAFAAALEAVRPEPAVARPALVDHARGTIRGGLLATGMVEALNRVAVSSSASEQASALPGGDGAAMHARGDLGGLIWSGANLVANVPRRMTRSAAVPRDGRPSTDSAGESGAAEPQHVVLGVADGEPPSLR